MPATLGMRGTGAFGADERPKNWREAILFLAPNGEAPLTALSSRLASEGTDDYEYSWWEKRLPTQRFLANGAHLAADTTITVVSGAKDCVKGNVILHETSGELLLVSSDPTSDTSLIVTRSFGAVGAAAISDQDAFTVIANVHEQGAETPTARAYAPTKKYNLTEIYRTALHLTRTARRTRLRWDNQGPYREAQREALSLHSIEMEKSTIWGERVETTGDAGQPMTMTGGILEYITTNKGGAWNIAGLLDEDVLDARLEELFRYGTNDRLVLAGSTWIRAFNTLAKRNGELSMTPASTTYGMRIAEYVTAYGTIMIKNHPLFSQHPVWRKNALFIDTKNIICRPLDETMFVKNRQSNGADASLDEFMTEIGAEWHFEETHAYMEGVTGALIA
jgi:hypothetical protein